MPKKTKLKNSNKMDMINGPIWNKLPRFALPVAATAILEQLFNASDIAVVGNKMINRRDQNRRAY